MYKEITAKRPYVCLTSPVKLNLIYAYHTAMYINTDDEFSFCPQCMMHSSGIKFNVYHKEFDTDEEYIIWKLSQEQKA